MDKTVSILISNRDSFQAIELCVESVRKYTRHPHQVIVYDDASTNTVDVEYLREAKKRGLIHEFIEGKKQLTHGGSLNVLINEICDTDYAAVLDCDTQVRGHGWLADLVNIISEDSQILGICDFKHEGIQANGYRTGFYTIWFGLLNMIAYRDGMQVDWMLSRENRNREPYKSLFDFLSGIPKPETFDENVVFNDPGSQLWVKVRYDNPKGYKVVNVPLEIFSKYRHFGHISMISIPHPSHSAQVKFNRETRFAQIKTELARLRCQA